MRFELRSLVSEATVLPTVPQEALPGSVQMFDPSVVSRYDIEHVPDRPNDSANNQMRVKFIDTNDKITVGEKFREDPVW